MLRALMSPESRSMLGHVLFLFWANYLEAFKNFLYAIEASDNVIEYLRLLEDDGDRFRKMIDEEKYVNIISRSKTILLFLFVR